MTLDYKDPDEIVKGKDLKEGDCVRSRSWSETKDGNDMGIILSTTFHDTERGKKLKKFYGDEPAYEIYDINCPCDSSLLTRLDPEAEFKVIRSRKDILYTFRTIDYQLLQRSRSLMAESIELGKVQDEAVERMNDRCDKIKKELEKDFTCKHAHANIDKIFCDTPDINSCPDGYQKLYTAENCPELKKIEKPFDKGIEII